MPTLSHSHSSSLPLSFKSVKTAEDYRAMGRSIGWLGLGQSAVWWLGLGPSVGWLGLSLPRLGRRWTLVAFTRERFAIR